MTGQSISSSTSRDKKFRMNAAKIAARDTWVLDENYCHWCSDMRRGGLWALDGRKRDPLSLCTPHAREIGVIW